MPLTPQDEFIHAIAPEPTWREALYFDFYDPATRLCAFGYLGVHPNQLRGWRNERLAAGSAEALARRKAEAAELARLRRENKRLEQENEILKKAAAFFAREAVAS